MGQLECDDGNTQNGDGCDSTCHVEAGYECYRRDDQPDVCADIVGPEATLSMKKSDVLKIKFSETSTSSLKSKS